MLAGEPTPCLAGLQGAPPIGALPRNYGICIYVYMYHMSYIHVYVLRANNMITTRAHLDAFIVKKVLQNV